VRRAMLKRAGTPGRTGIIAHPTSRIARPELFSFRKKRYDKALRGDEVPWLPAFFR